MVRVSVSRVSKLARHESHDELLPPRLRGDGVKMEALERRILYAAGDLDASFGDGGIVTADLLGTSAEDLLIDGHGRMLVAGALRGSTSDASSLFLTRYLADGTLDTTFGGGDGQVVWDDMKSAAVSLDIDAAGNILVAGDIWSDPTKLHADDWGVWRFHADGSLDASFGSNGFVHSNSYATDSVRSVVALPDGKVITVGNIHWESGHQLINVSRYLSDGTLDEMWDGDGHKWVFIEGVQQSYAGGATTLADGSLLITGGTFTINADHRMTGSELLLVKIDPTGFGGASDGDTFGVLSNPAAGSRVVRTPLSGFTALGDAAIDSGGRIVVAGMSDARGILARYTADGALDTTFGTDGIARSPYGDYGGAADIAIDADDNILVTSGFYMIGRSTLARFLADGQVDRSFGDDGGTQPAVPGASNVIIRDIMLDAAGNVIVAGIADGGSMGGTRMFLARILAPAPVPIELQPAPDLETSASAISVRPTAPVPNDWSITPLALPDSLLLEPKEDDQTIADWLAA